MLGFEYEESKGQVGDYRKPSTWGWTNTRSIAVPYWFLCGLVGAYPFVVVVRGPLRRRQRALRGSCPRCGYDLFGLDEGRCPECGHLFDVDKQRCRRAIFEQRRTRALVWFETYSHQRVRKTVAGFLVALGLLSLVVWLTSNLLWMECEVHTLACRAMGGNLVLYYRPMTQDDGGPNVQRRWGCRAGEYHGPGAGWWSDRIIWRGYGWTFYIPLLPATILWALAWAWLYRPIYRLRWRGLTANAPTT
jgi:hypothetical protein